MAPGTEEAGFIRALEATTGQMRWEFPFALSAVVRGLVDGRRVGLWRQP